MRLPGPTVLSALAIGLMDDFTSRALGSVNSLFGQLQSFNGALAERLGAGFGLAGMILHAAEDFGRLVHKIESCLTAIWCRRPTKAQDVFVPAD